MKVILYMAITANGYIAKENDETPWSDEEWKSFVKIVGECKNMIIGRKTFEIMKNKGEFEKIGDLFTVVVSDKQGETSQFVNSPKSAINTVSKKGFSRILVAGGGMLNSSFMKEGLIDEIYLDIEPFVFGKGIKLFSDNKFEAKLDLLETKQLSKNTIQLHYKIIK